MTDASTLISNDFLKYGRGNEEEMSGYGSSIPEHGKQNVRGSQ